jgi:putative flippase GtrA
MYPGMYELNASSPSSGERRIGSKKQTPSVSATSSAPLIPPLRGGCEALGSPMFNYNSPLSDLKSKIASLLSERGIGRYLIIGGIVFVVDIGTFQALLLNRTPVLVATVIAYLIALAAHFVLNRYLNFKAFSRTIHEQFRTYLIIQLGLLALTLVIVQLLSGFCGAPPLFSRGVAIVVNIPLGYSAHRYLTFEAGIKAVYRRYRKARDRA